MAKLLFETKSRGEAHRRLAELLSAHPSAECREDSSGRYMVWDGPATEESRTFANKLANDLATLRNQIFELLVKPLTEAGVLETPPEVVNSMQQIDKITSSLAHLQPEELQPLETRISEDLLPWLKCALIDGRLRTATELDEVRKRIHDHDLLGRLDARLAPYDAQMNREWSGKTVGARLPQLSDYLTLERVEARSAPAPLERRYDEKFHLLQAPDLLFAHMNHYRAACKMRGVPLVLAFLDVDDFKSFNDQFGEVNVDRLVLPRLMAAIEHHVFVHGLAYRFGGDEYAVLLPNADAIVGRQSIVSLQARLAAVAYPSPVTLRPTISAGLIEVRPDSFWTNLELLDFAVHAKKEAKALGKNRGKSCVCTYDERKLDSDNDPQQKPNTPSSKALRRTGPRARARGSRR